MSDLKEIYHWIKKQKKKQKIIVKKKHIFNLKLWKSEKQKIFHLEFVCLVFIPLLAILL